MNKQIFNRNFPLFIRIKFRKKLLDFIVEIYFLFLNQFRAQQTCNENFRYTCQIINRIEFRFDFFRFDDGKTERVLTDNLAFFRDEITGRRKIFRVNS